MQSQMGGSLKVKKKHLSYNPPKMKGRQKLMNAAEFSNKDCDIPPNHGSPATNDLVIYNHNASYASQNAAKEIDGSDDLASSFQNSLARGTSTQAVGAFTVQCAACFKWRLIPSKEKYEEIREKILENPFVCDQAREWRPDISCDDPADLQQDGSRVWAIDKPNIAQPPPGWERLIRIRAQGSTKFADVYYSSPTGKKLRSMVEVEKHLCEHPEYISQGINIGQFSFQSPKPLWDNYLRKRPRGANHNDELVNSGITTPFEPSEVAPLSWETPDASLELRIGSDRASRTSAPDADEADDYDLFAKQSPSYKKRTKIKITQRQIYSSPLFNQTKAVEPEDAELSRTSPSPHEGEVV